MAVNKPAGDNARKGAVKKRSQLQTKTQGQKSWTKRKTKGAVGGSSWRKRKPRNSKASDERSSGRTTANATDLPGVEIALLLELGLDPDADFRIRGVPLDRGVR
jgi:hypothetical protein